MNSQSVERGGQGGVGLTVVCRLKRGVPFVIRREALVASDNDMPLMSVASLLSLIGGYHTHSVACIPYESLYRLNTMPPVVMTLRAYYESYMNKAHPALGNEEAFDLRQWCKHHRDTDYEDQCRPYVFDERVLAEFAELTDTVPRRLFGPVSPCAHVSVGDGSQWHWCPFPFPRTCFEFCI